MAIGFEETYEKWLQSLLAGETNPRRRTRIENGLEHDTLEFLAMSGFRLLEASDTCSLKGRYATFTTVIDISIWPTCPVTVSKGASKSREMDLMPAIWTFAVLRIYAGGIVCSH